MAVQWDKNLFDLAYDFSAEPDGHSSTRPEIRLHYHRYVLYPECLRRATFFKDHFLLDGTDRVLIIGSGFGWTAEALNGMGVPTVGTDTSPYIQGNKTLSEETEIANAVSAAGLTPTNGEGLGHFNRLRGDGVRTRANVLNEDHGNNSSRQRVRNAFDASITLIITEDLLTSMSDAEITTLRSNIEKYNVPPLVHFVTELANPNPPFNFNSKTLTQWKTLLPLDTIVADGDPYRVM